MLKWPGLSVMAHDETEEVLTSSNLLVQQILDYLQQRFPLGDHIANYGLLALSNVPQSVVGRIAYGNEEVLWLVELFHLDQEMTQMELTGLRASISTRIPNYRDMETNMATTLVLKDELLRKKIPELSKLLQIALSLPVSTAICERGFSTQNVIKTLQRNRLNNGSLYVLLRIVANGPPPDEIDHRMSAKAWLASSHYKTEGSSNRKQNPKPNTEDGEIIDRLIIVPVDMALKRKLIFGGEIS